MSMDVKCQIKSCSVETLQTQLHSARKSILFMETQHAATLKGLHLEIQNLQKKCSELTFEAAMRTKKTEAETALSNVIDQLKKDVADLTREKVVMLQLLEDKDRQFVELESHAISQERKYLNELKVKNHRIAALTSEIESRGDTVGFLTAQLHQAKSKLHCLMQKNPPSSVAPAPPSKPRSPSHLHRNSKSVDANFRPLSSGSKSSLARPGRAADPSSVGRPSSASVLSAPDKIKRPFRRSGSHFSPSPMPDPAPFLTAADNKEAVFIPRPPSVLPPIDKRDMLQDANGNPVRDVTSYSVYKSRDAKHERFQKTEAFTVSTSSPELKVKESSGRTSVRNGAVL